MRAGWATASVGALVATAAGLALAEAAALGFRVAAGGPFRSATTVRAGGLLFATFNHTPLRFDARLRAAGGLPAAAVSVRLAMGLLLGTALIGAALMFAGRAVGRRTGGSALARGAHGAKVAVPYAALCTLAALASKSVIGAATVSGSALLDGTIVVRPSFPEAVLWPLAIGVVFGVAGGLWSSAARREPGTERTAERAAVGALAGGGTMVAAGLALAFVGLLVLAAVQPNDTRAYLHGSFAGGPARGAAAIGATLLVVPNMSAWVLYPSMGACVQATGTSVSSAGAIGAVGARSTAACLLSYGSFPTAGVLRAGGVTPGGPGTDGSTPPAGFLAFLIVPLIAVLGGGWVAARAGRVGSRREGAAVGALSGVVFAGLSAFVVLLSWIGVDVAGSGAARIGGEQSLAVGPELLVAIGVALVWGVVGGAIGGSVRKPASGRERVFSTDQAEGSSTAVPEAPQTG